MAGPPGARVHVRWQPELDATRREALERAFSLTLRERLDPSTWRYDLVDLSPANVRALVEHPAAADTHDIDRSTFTISAAAVRTARRQRFGDGGNGVVALADFSALLAGAAAMILLALGAAGRARTPEAFFDSLDVAARRLRSAVASAARPAGRALQRGIPAIDARTAGVFRLVFGTMVVLYFATDPVD